MSIITQVFPKCDCCGKEFREFIEPNITEEYEVEEKMKGWGFGGNIHYCPECLKNNTV